MSYVYTPVVTSDDELGAQSFVQEWARIWREHDGENWPQMFHEGFVARNPLGDVQREQLPAFMANLLSSMPDHAIRLTHWAATTDGVLLEWIMTGTLPTGPIEISGVDRFTLKGGKSTDGAAYFDPRPMIQA